jgi:hypothetical protein
MFHRREKHQGTFWVRHHGMRDPTGSAPPDRCISCRRDGASREVRIADEGPEIPAFARLRIFETLVSRPRPDSGRRAPASA